MSLFNSPGSVFDCFSLNGDTIADVEILQPVRPKSDFYITPPVFKVDPLIQEAIDTINRSITDHNVEETENKRERIRWLTSQIASLPGKIAEKKNDTARVQKHNSCC